MTQNHNDPRPENQEPVIDGGAGAEAEAPAAEEMPQAEPAAPAEDERTARIAELEAEVAKLKDAYVRAHAEMENVRKRAEAEVGKARKFAVADFAKEMLSVADNLGRALQAVPEDRKEADDVLKTLAEGVDMTGKGLVSALAKFGIRPVEAQGKPFDPNLHQAMMEIDDPSQPSGTVVMVMQDGYVLHDRLLRPAMVGVSKGGPKISNKDPEAGPGGNFDESA